MLFRTRTLTSATAVFGALGFWVSSAIGAEPALATGFNGALKGCEEWVLNPKSWIDGPAPFMAATGLGDQITPLSKVGDFALPPRPLRRANHYWRIDATDAAGFVLVTSDQLPMCHITGAGRGDFRSSVEAVLTGDAFRSRWERTGAQVSGNLTSTNFRSRLHPSFSLVVSRATTGTQSQGGVQVIATAQVDIGK